MIDLNATFFVQLVNFVLILILLNVILIGPIRKILKKRAEFVASQMEGIESFASSADAKLKDYELSLDGRHGRPHGHEGRGTGQGKGSARGCRR